MENQFANLVRGATVKIADTVHTPELRGVETTIRSKGLVTCKGDTGSTAAPCAGPWCVGKAVFVVDPNVEPAPEGKRVGWRHGAAQVCLTHILTADGQPVIPAPEAEPQPVVVPDIPRLTLPLDPQPEVESITAGPVPGIVTWVALAHAHARKDLDALAKMARSLKSENDYLMRRLVDAQDQMLARLSENADQ